MKDENNILQNSPVTTECNMAEKREGNTDYATILWNFLLKTLTFVMSIELTVQWYYNFVDKYFFIEALAYTLPFICVIVLLSDLLINDEETDQKEHEDTSIWKKQ